MPTHWTYADVPDHNSDLEQGDIVEPTPELISVFEKVHRHFCDPKYVAFLVTTQTCDLVRRKKGDCKADYIGLAAVKELNTVLPGLLDRVCSAPVAGVYPADKKEEARRFLHRLVNQNEQTLGLLYLHGDADAGIAVPSVAYLRVMISMRAEHYEVLRSARRGRLAPEFCNKLGWLIGNLYSRIGTRDWDEEGEKALIEQLLRFEGTDPAPVWIEPSWLNEAKKLGLSLKWVPSGEVHSTLQKIAPPNTEMLAVLKVVEICRSVLPNLTDDDAEKLIKRLLNNGGLKQAMKAVQEQSRWQE